MSDVDAFVVYMRHELRTPINAILGYSQLLLEEDGDGKFLSEAERRDLERVADSGKQLFRVITDVLDPTQVAEGRISEYAVQLRHAMRTPLTSIHGYVEILLEEHESDPIADDLRRIRSASARLAELIDSVEQIYCVRVGAAHDIVCAVPAHAARAAEALDVSPDEDVAGGSILVIDDEEANRSLLVRRLALHGHSVLTAETGEEGLAIAARDAIDVILLDVLMPGISGYEVLARLKADDHLREIPVLMITALDETASVTRCLAIGADDYLPKPFDPVVLGARVRAGVRRKRARDFELAYLRGVDQVTAAASAVESGRFVAESLDEVAQRDDALGNLARLFQRMGVEVAARQRRLEDQVQQLTIAIDERKKAEQVHEITDSDYFRTLQARARDFSARRAARARSSE
jgi:DNA-binding response OmpR family regulator